MARNCGNCGYCAENGEDWVCVNDQSEYFSDFVEPDYACDEWCGDEEEE